jgi:hypothetical protein
MDQKKENESKKIKEQKLIEESDNKICKDLFSNNPHVTDKLSGVSVVKIGKNKFVSVIKPAVIEEKVIPTNLIKPEKKINKCYDLNDYDYDYDYIDYN